MSDASKHLHRNFLSLELTPTVLTTRYLESMWSVMNLKFVSDRVTWQVFIQNYGFFAVCQCILLYTG